MIETVMTYEEWQREYSRKQRYKKREKIYYAKQKIVGLTLIITGIASIILFKDATIGIGIIPMGSLLILTRERMIMWKVITRKPATWAM